MASPSATGHTWVAPSTCAAFGGSLCLIGAKWPWWLSFIGTEGPQWGNPHSVRLGVVAILVAVVWCAAENFSLVTFRIVAFLALIMSVVLLVRVGERQRLTQEYSDFMIELASVEVEFASLGTQVSAATAVLAAGAEVAAEKADAAAIAADQLRVGPDGAEPTDQGTTEDDSIGIEEVVEQAEQSAEQAQESANEAEESARQAEAAAATTSFEAERSFRSGILMARSQVAGCKKKLNRSDAENMSGEMIDGPCGPREARSLLLSTLLGTLRGFAKEVPSGDLADAIDTRRAEVRVQLDSLGEPIAVHRLVIDGADAVVGDSLDGLLEDDALLRLGGWGWIVFAALMIVIYRTLEIANGYRYGGPILVDVPAGDDADLAEATQRIRMWLGAAELREPPPIPGGEATRQVAGLVQDVVPQGKSLEPVIKLFQATAFPKKGATLSVTLDKIDDGQRRLAIRVSDHRTGSLMFVQSFEGTNLDQLSSDAAHFGAERVMERSRVTPGWTTWNSSDGSALRSYQTVLMAQQGPGNAMKPEERLLRLRSAVSGSPATGVALVALSNEEALDGNLVRALTLALRAGHAHPRMLVARFRAGVTASMLASLPKPFEPDANDSKAVAELKHVIADRYPDLMQTKEDVKGDLLRLAELELTQSCAHHVKPGFGLGKGRTYTVIKHGSGFWFTVRRGVRSEERSYWLALARNRRRRRQLQTATLISLQLVELRLVVHGVSSAATGSSRPQLPAFRKTWIGRRVKKVDKLVQTAEKKLQEIAGLENDAESVKKTNLAQKAAKKLAEAKKKLEGLVGLVNSAESEAAKKKELENEKAKLCKVQKLVGLVKSAESEAAKQQKLREVKKLLNRWLLERRVQSLINGAGVDAIALYDAGCFYSELAGVVARWESEGPNCEESPAADNRFLQKSAELIMAARMASEGHAISSAWVKIDPDLACLRDSSEQHWGPLLDQLKMLETWGQEERDQR